MTFARLSQTADTGQYAVVKPYGSTVTTTTTTMSRGKLFAGLGGGTRPKADYTRKSQTVANT